MKTVSGFPYFEVQFTKEAPWTMPPRCPRCAIT